MTKASNILILVIILITGLMLAIQPAFASPYRTRSLMMDASTLKAGANKVIFKSGQWNLAGLLFAPKGFDGSRKYPGVVITTPFNQVKEQTGSIYAKKLADLGYLAFVFDHRGYGESEGDLRSYEYTPAKLESISDAISFLRMHAFVDRSRLYGLGICAGANYIVMIALTDKRLQAIATVSGMLNNTASLFAAMDRKTAVDLLKAANEAHQKYYETGIQENVDFFGMSQKPKDDAPLVSKEGYDYYMTARAGKQRYPRYTHLAPLFVHEDYPRYNATAVAQYLYTPYLGIYGSKAMASTGPLTVAFHEAASQPKELFEVEGASHVSLYDIDKDVDRAVVKMDEFFKKYITE